MTYKFTIRETVLLLTIVAFASAFVASAICSRQSFAGTNVSANSVMQAIQSISPQAKRANSCGWDGRTRVRLCFEYDVPEQDARNFLGELKDQLATDLNCGGDCQLVDLGQSLFRNDIQEMRFESSGYVVDVALYLLDDSPSAGQPLPPTSVLGTGYRRLRFVVTSHVSKK